MKSYGVIIADPPWMYANNGTNGAAEKHYPVMRTEDITDLPVRNVAAPDCVLLMWATWPTIPDALNIAAAWGFKYVSGFPWVKIREIGRTFDGSIEIVPNWGVGFWARGCTELVMIFKRGNASPPEGDFMGILSPNARHSRKPENLYEYAEAMPGPYLEMFARRPRDGWDVFGNEVEGSISLEYTDV